MIDVFDLASVAVARTVSLRAYATWSLPDGTDPRPRDAAPRLAGINVLRVLVGDWGSLLFKGPTIVEPTS